MGRFPDVHPSEWADFFGVDWKDKTTELRLEGKPRQPGSGNRLPDSGSQQVDLDTSSHIEQPTSPYFWFVNSVSAKIQSESRQSSVSLAPEINEEPKPVEIRYFESDAQWRVRLDQLLAIEESLEVPDIDQCIHKVACCEPVNPVPLQKERFHNTTTTILIDHNPALEPIHGWRRQQVSLIRALVGEQMTNIEPVEYAPLHVEHRQQLIEKSLQTTRTIILTSLDSRWVDSSEIRAWKKVVSQLQAFGSDVLILQPEIKPVNKAVLNRILGCASGLVYPECYTLVALARLLGGGLQDALAAWNHPDLTCPAHIFHISDAEHKRDLASYYEQIPCHEIHGVNSLVASHRAIKPDCQIAMESLSRAAQGLEPLPTREWIERLVLSTAAMSIESRAAYFRGLASEYESIRRCFGQHPELQLLFKLVDVVIPEQPDQPEQVDTINIVPLQNNFKLTQGHHQHTIYNAVGPFFSLDGMLLKDGFRSGESEIQISAKDHTFILTPLKLPNWADRIHRDTENRLLAVHQSGTQFEKVSASASNPISFWRNHQNTLEWAADTGIDENGLWADLAIKDSTYRLRWIPPGEFNMGSPETEEGRYEDESLHAVELSSGFWLGETTVTNEFWQSVMGAQENDKSATQPATGISWDDCSAFIKALAELNPTLAPRFPTEAEWEYACRAGTKTAYWWGNTWSEEYGNNGSGPTEEKKYPSNAFGLKSTHGNVLEWCNDWYGEYPEGKTIDPQGPADGRSRVLRGGSWFGDPRTLRAANRSHFSPVYRFDYYGFRLAGGDPQAGRQQGASATADRGEGTESQRGGQVRRAGR